MVNLFLDIETVPDMSADQYFDAQREVESGTLTRNSEDSDRFWKYDRGALTPIDGKVVLITYKFEHGYIHRLKEWESDEKDILARFYNTIKESQRGGNGDWLRIVGHNILNFDIIFLYRRMQHYKIDDENRLYRYMVKNPLKIDFIQTHLPLNGFNLKGLRHDVLAHAYGLPTKQTQGSDETLHYFQQDYDKILGYSEREFVYPELYARIKSGGMVSAERLAESIKWYDDLHAEQDA